MITDALCQVLLTAWSVEAATVPPLLLAHLRQVQAALSAEALTDLTTPDAGHQAAVLAVLDVADPNPTYQTADYPVLLQRVREAVDSELFRWTSARVQPLGPAGEMAVAPTPE